MNDIVSNLAGRLGTESDPGWLKEARRAILESFRNDGPVVGEIARAVGLTDADFREHLAERGSSFEAFVDDLRATLAVTYVEDARLSLETIGPLVGFTDRDEFFRTFLRWTGSTPSSYRRHQTEGPGHP